MVICWLQKPTQQAGRIDKDGPPRSATDPVKKELSENKGVTESIASEYLTSERRQTI